MKRYPILLRRIYEIDADVEGNLPLATLGRTFCLQVMDGDAVLLLQREGLTGLIPRETFENVWRMYDRWRLAMPNRDSMPTSVGVIRWEQTIPIPPRVLKALQLESHKGLGKEAPKPTDA